MASPKEDFILVDEAPTSIEPTTLKMEWKSEFASYDSKEQHIYVNGHLQAPTCHDSDRKPIDVVVVLDRSGSMRGEKLELCLKTVQFLIRELSALDRLSIVSYDTTVRTDVPLTKMDQKGKHAIELALPRIRAGSATNLSGGLLQGLAEIQTQKRNDGEPPNPIKSVMLLTDGMANAGIVSAEQLVETIGCALHEDVSLFTFGYGNHHNDSMLRQLSDVGRGVYYFVENADGVSLAFADCLGGLLSVVAQNIKLECKLHNGCEVVSIKTKKEVKTIQEHTHYEIEVGDLYGDEERDILLELKVPALLKEVDDSLGVITCKLTYANVIQSSFEAQDSELAVERPINLPTERVPNSHVIYQKNRILTAEAIEEATTLANRGDLRLSKPVLEGAKRTLSTTLNKLSIEDEENTKDLIQDLSTCLESVVSRSVYDGAGCKQMSSASQSHYAQRSNCIPMSADMYAGSADTGPAKRYRSKKKAGMMSKAFAYSKSS